MIVDPESPPGRILVVPDLNTIMDVALDWYASPQRTAALSRPAETRFSARFTAMSLAFFESISTARFGAVDGVPVSVFGSYEALSLLATKLRQPLTASNPEFRGFGWSDERAEEFIEDFFLPLVFETEGEMFYSAPAVDPDRFGGEDGRIIGIADRARRLHAPGDTTPVVVTRDKGMINAAGKQTFKQPGLITVVRPQLYVNDERAFVRRLKAERDGRRPTVLSAGATPRELGTFLGERRPPPVSPPR